MRLWRIGLDSAVCCDRSSVATTATRIVHFRRTSRVLQPATPTMSTSHRPATQQRHVVADMDDQGHRPSSGRLPHCSRYQRSRQKTTVQWKRRRMTITANPMTIQTRTTAACCRPSMSTTAHEADAAAWTGHSGRRATMHSGRCCCRQWPGAEKPLSERAQLSL